MRFPYPVAHDVPLFLAPMAGVSEAPFRRLCRSFGADVVVSEFLSCEGLRRGRAKALPAAIGASTSLTPDDGGPFLSSGQDALSYGSTF